ncbi:MAG TPA: NAD(P)H-dependent oxidoreductase [Oligoflexia bacterium]|nr:NAD(P)H-dependent oxidoreductase [Oligoflexia bacterium]HMP27231.1 NAD(P)H-dependent oxidoreductase [Oligoflexia bacterium]
MKISIISGSHRANSQSLKVSNYISSRAQVAGFESSQVISLSNNPLPLWDEEMWSENPNKWHQLWSPIAEKLKNSDAFAIVAPEWAGMAPAGLKNLFLLCDHEEVGHKPALLVAVSSGIGGSYPIAELRASSYKNNRILYIPEHIIVRNVENMLNAQTPSNDHDQSIRERIDYTLKILFHYSIALKQVRQSGVLDYEKFPYGM